MPALDPHHALDFAEFILQHVFKQKQQGIESLILTRCRDLLPLRVRLAFALQFIVKP